MAIPSTILKIRFFPHTVLFLLCLWLPLEFFVLGKYSVFLMSDNTEIILSRLMVLQYGNGESALWDPYTSAGADRKTFSLMGQIDVFLFSTLPAWFAHSLRVTSQTIIGFLATYALGRRTFGFGPGASLFTAAAYAVIMEDYGILLGSVSGYMPGVLLALSYLLDDKTDFKRWVFAALAIYVITQTAFFSRLIPSSIAMIIAWFLFADHRKRFGDWLIILGSSVLVFMLRFGDFVALRALYPSSQLPLTRHLADFDAVLAQALDVSRLFQNLWLTPCLLLFVYALMVRGLGDFRMKGLLVWILLMQAFTPVVVGFEILLAPVIPFLRGAELERASGIISIGWAVAGGYGIQVLLEQIKERHTEMSLGVWLRGGAIVLAACAIMFISVKKKYSSALNWMTHGNYVHVFESPMLKKFAATIRSKPMPERVEPFQMAPGYLNAYGLETVGAYHTLYGRRYYELWAAMAEPWASRLDPKHPLAKFFAERRRHNRDWPVFRGDRLWLFPNAFQPSARVGENFNLNLLSLLNVSYLVSRDRLTDKSLVPIREMASSWSSLDHAEKAKISLRANVLGREHLFIYRNQDAFPRFFSAPRIRTFETGKQVLRALAGASLDELRGEVFVESGILPDSLSADRSYGRVDVRVVNYASDVIELAVETVELSVLIAGNGFSPYWVCEIDGVRTPVFPAYHALWGVAVPPGAKSIVFRYAPPY